MFTFCGTGHIFVEISSELSDHAIIRVVRPVHPSQERVKVHPCYCSCIIGRRESKHGKLDSSTTMPHLTQAIAARKAPFHTYEFFPPRTEAGLVNLLDRIRRLAAAPLPAPIAVSVTWGAGGATADRSLELAEHVVKMGLEVILHLTCTNMPKAKVDEALQVGSVSNDAESGGEFR